MEHVLFFGALFAAAACFAKLEIQIEGPAGWAANLPTWRLRNTWLNRLFPGRPLTGYHLYILLFIALVAHLPFAFGLPWSKLGELKAVSFILLFWVVEDFLWFVLNPHYGVRRFRPQFIEWHRQAWWWIAPRDYWLAGAIGVLFYVMAAHQPEKAILVAMRR